MEETSASQNSKLKLAEGNLETKKKSFEAERRRLEEKVEYSERIFNLKRRQMYNRYKKIRQEMGGLLERIKCTIVTRKFTKKWVDFWKG